jgi:hypothetical protein
MAKKLIAEYWYCKPENIVLAESGKNTWSIQQGNKLMVNNQVKLKAGRYRFERIVTL